MRPSKFIAHQERRLGRPLLDAEIAAIQLARATCSTGHRNMVKAMWAAMVRLSRDGASQPRRQGTAVHLMEQQERLD
jgi:hypothetical protein